MPKKPAPRKAAAKGKRGGERPARLASPRHDAASSAPARGPDVVDPDPQEVYDHSIAEYEEDPLREAMSEPAEPRRPGTSTERQAEHPSPSTRDEAQRRPKAKARRKA